MLRAQGDTLTAFGAGSRAFAQLLGILPLRLYHLIGVKHPLLVPQGKIAGNVDTEGTGHAILAARTTVSDSVTHGLSDCIEGSTLSL